VTQLKRDCSGVLGILRRFEVVIDGKAHTISLDYPITERSKIRAAVDGKRAVALLSHLSKGEPSGILRINNRDFHVDFSGMSDASSPMIRVDGHMFSVKLRELPLEPLETEQPLTTAREITVPHGVVVAPIPGKVMSVRVGKGDLVRSGQPILLLEAMKMENEIASPKAGTVKDVWVAEGTTVTRGQKLLEIS